MSSTSHGTVADETHVSSLHSIGLLLAAGIQDLEGTVPAKLAGADYRSYSYSSEELIRGRPVHATVPVRSPQKVSAKDLVAELDSINAQIHRIMFQVERAVARLATSG